MLRQPYERPLCVCVCVRAYVSRVFDVFMLLQLLLVCACAPVCLSRVNKYARTLRSRMMRLIHLRSQRNRSGGIIVADKFPVCWHNEVPHTKYSLISSRTHLRSFLGAFGYPEAAT